MCATVNSEIHGFTCVCFQCLFFFLAAFTCVNCFWFLCYVWLIFAMFLCGLNSLQLFKLHFVNNLINTFLLQIESCMLTFNNRSSYCKFCEKCSTVSFHMRVFHQLIYNMLRKNFVGKIENLPFFSRPHFHSIHSKTFATHCRNSNSLPYINIFGHHPQH